MPPTRETMSDKRLTGIYTPVKILAISTSASAKPPDSIDKKARLTGLLFLDNLCIIIKTTNETARIIKKTVKFITSLP